MNDLNDRLEIRRHRLYCCRLHGKVHDMYYGSNWMIDSFRILSSPTSNHGYRPATEGIAVGLAAIAPKADFSSWPRIGRVAASKIG